MVSRIITSAAVLLATTSFSTTALAGCKTSSTYCDTSSSSLAPIGTWPAKSSTHQYESSHHGSHHGGASYGSVTLPGTFSPAASHGSTYSSVTLPGTFSPAMSYGGVMSDSQASATYGSGSISNTYTGGNVQMHGFHGSTTSVPGLGAGEFLQNTNCPVNVYIPEGGKVLGCYSVVKQERRTNYIRVVRPIIYVRYPVHVPVYTGCGMAYGGGYSYSHHQSSYSYGSRYGGGSRYSAGHGHSGNCR